MGDRKKDAPRRGGRVGELKGSRCRKGLSAEVEIPVSLERVLLVAARDPAFAEALLADPAEAVAARGITMRESEAETLRAMPPEALRSTIERLDPPRQRNQRFIRAVAAAGLAGTVVFGAVDCAVEGGVGPAPDAGIDPDSSIDADADADVDWDVESDGGTSD